MASALYRGRFAPSPTGPLHFGSLVAAVGSYLEAKSHNGTWLVRMEDLDPPREMPGAADAILKALEAYGFEWDEPVLYQSQRSEYYEAALAKLRQDGQLYACACTRKEIADSAPQGIEGPIYPGTCRSGLADGKPPRAWRVRVNESEIVFEDAIQGTIC
ncbi:MAG TPA: glutamate--tRNA ligase family protein, partial [Methylophilaceae bacterium]|nr:glutamate--tRNA ligase family protein [Methylophilaceae bacterium]